MSDDRTHCLEVTVERVEERVEHLFGGALGAAKGANTGDDVELSRLGEGFEMNLKGYEAG